MTRVQPSAVQTTSLEASNYENLQREIAAETAERITGRKMAAREARQKLRANSLEMLENLEKVAVDLGSTENMSQDSVDQLAALLRKLKWSQSLVKGRVAMQVQPKMNPGPRIVVLFQKRKIDGQWVRELVTSLKPDMKEVCFGLLCEDPGHEHIVDDTTRMFNRDLGEDFAKNLQPMITAGLHVVMRAMSSLEAANALPGSWEAVTLHCVETVEPWDLRAIDRDVYENLGLNLLFEEDPEDVDAVKQAENTAAEWFLIGLENAGGNILKKFGLQRVRYKVDFSHGTRGTFAWLCTERLKIGLDDGTMEAYPLKYSNVEDDFRLRCPAVRTYATI